MSNDGWSARSDRIDVRGFTLVTALPFYLLGAHLIVPSLRGSFEVALIQCEDCGRDVSDRAPACPNCGAPIAAAADKNAPEGVTFDDDCFVGTRAAIVRLAVKAIQNCNYKVDAADEASGLVSFTTGMTMGSWSGVSGSIYFEETGPYRYRPSGNAKQNVKGGQMIALDLFGEAKNKVRKIVEQMQYLSGYRARSY